MKTYQQKQAELFDFIETSFKQGKTPSTISKTIEDYSSDNRICLTGVSFLPNNLQQIITDKIIAPLKKADPSVYFYPSSSLHLTVQNIRTIAEPPLFTQDDINKAISVFEQVIPKHPKIKFKLKGLFNLPSSIALKAFCDESLKKLVLELKSELTKAGVADNKVYASDEVFFGNITICRYPATPNSSFFNTVEKFKEIEFGELEVSTIHLVTGNIVFADKKTTLIRDFNLGNTNL